MNTEQMVERSAVICDLQNALQGLYLTGSYFFGGASTNSDIDFFTDQSNADCGVFHDTGWELELNSYNDNNTICVWRHKSGVDVQIVSDIRRKLTAQMLLQEMLNHWIIRHDQLKSKDIWNWVFTVADRMNNAAVPLCYTGATVL